LATIWRVYGHIAVRAASGSRSRSCLQTPVCTNEAENANARPGNTEPDRQDTTSEKINDPLLAVAALTGSLSSADGLRLAAMFVRQPSRGQM
jgi:hypothetical protein